MAARRCRLDPHAKPSPVKPCGVRVLRVETASSPVRVATLSSRRVPKPPSSSGLGHHPFKVAARVRIPLGVPDRFAVRHLVRHASSEYI